MSNILNLKIKIKTKPQFLSPNVVYGVYLVFKFRDPKKFPSKPRYVNLKYKKGCETLHAYFAKPRDDKWMIIELCRFLNDGEDSIFEFQLESFSRCYCGNDAIYVEGIEFQTIENMKQDEIDKSMEVKHVLKSNSNMNPLQPLPVDGGNVYRRSEKDEEGEKFSLIEVNGKNHLMLSAKEVLHDSSNVKLFHLKPSAHSRFQEVIELLQHQVLHIKCKIESQMLSPSTDYACYLVFKLSEKCCGLHCPVKVKDLLHRKDKDSRFVYLRCPSPLHDGNGAPVQRKDGWMEVMVWKFNSDNEFRKNCIPINLKLITYEGTMLGLIISGLECRPM